MEPTGAAPTHGECHEPHLVKPLGERLSGSNRSSRISQHQSHEEEEYDNKAFPVLGKNMGSREKEGDNAKNKYLKKYIF